MVYNWKKEECRTITTSNGTESEERYMNRMKKRWTSLLLILVLIVSIAPATAEMMVGGWENVPCEAGTLPEDAQATFDKAREGLVGAVYTPVALLSTQVVAGTNYCILCQIAPVVPDPVPVWALVYLYADLQGNVEITNVYELYIANHAYPAE